MELQELYEHFEEEKSLFHGYASQVEYLTTIFIDMQIHRRRFWKSVQAVVHILSP